MADTDTIPDFILRCPNDGTKMEKVQAGEYIIDRCGTCGSIWFDLAELQRILAHEVPVEKFDIGGDMRSTASPEYEQRVCPRDSSPLIDVSDINQPHIRYQTCTVCGGVLMAAGDVKDIAHFSVVERLKAFFRL
ncbi:MAG: zf-TFIIB domain-containing protein [Phycisphaeraceae bacterium]|nr:zf-TFIIB domain-containing protein [Phycisphaeraceae bacterium]